MTNSKDPGLGSKYDREVKRLINEDGSYNIIRHGALSGIKDFYKYLIDISWARFLIFFLFAYLLVNALFACIYITIGIDQISGTNSDQFHYLNAYFFSVQTLTSVGYGQMSPVGLGANIVASLESFIGLMSIALITGLLYGRFSKPTSKLKFSKNVIIAPFQDKTAMMFKMVNQRNAILLNAKVSTMLILDKGGEDASFNKTYHQLDLQIDSVNFFPLTWTIVHSIDEKSPFHGLTIEDIKYRNAEVIVLVEAFDETHSQMIIEKHSFGDDQWRSGVQFVKNFKTNDAGRIELFIDELDTLIKNEE